MKNEIQDSAGRPVKLLQIQKWNLPQELHNRSRHFVCFLACDASEISDEQIRSFAEQLLEKGMVYLCAWGPDCERVHDITDSLVVENELETDNPNTIMTTWHNDESLDDALWFALYATCPTEAFETTCNCSLVIVINNGVWAEHISQRLSNLQQFNADVT